MQVIDTWAIDALKRPDSFNEDLGCLIDSGQQSISMGGEYVIPEGQTTKEAVEIVIKNLKVMIELGHNFQITLSNYSEKVTELSNNRDYIPQSAAALVLSRMVPDSQKIINLMNLSQSIPGKHLFGIELLGGKISQVPSNATAYYPRDANYLYDCFSYWNSALDYCNNQQFINELFQLVYHPEEDNVFVGFPINGLLNHPKAYYGENIDRLRTIKAQIDPLNLLPFPTGYY